MHSLASKLKRTAPNIGILLAFSGAAVSCIGVTANNLELNHIAAMNFWRISNIIFLVWAFGFWRKWWDGGVSGLPLVAMYSYYVITNEIGLTGASVIP